MALNQVPQANQTLAVTQAPILQNFADIDAAFLVDHVDYNTAGQGKHNRVTLPEQAASPTTLVNEVALFSRQSPQTGVAELAIRKENNGVVYEFTGALANTNGWTRLPSGILLKWGTANANGNATTTISFPVAGTVPVFSNIYSIQVTTNNGSNATPNQLVTLGNYNVLNFVVFNRQLVGFASAVNFTYLAIGD